MANMTVFNCKFCGKERSEKTSHFLKRENHFCSRLCANRSQAIRKWSGLSRSEYEKKYWSIPKNKERQKINKHENQKKRQAMMGDSFKRMVLGRCKERAKNKGIEFNITIEDIIVPKYCPILNIELKPFNKQGGSYNSPSIDRIDNSKGYIKGNIQVISKRANMIKTDATLEEILLVAEYLKKFSLLP